MKKDEITTNSLAHTKWDCKYHIVFLYYPIIET